MSRKPLFVGLLAILLCEQSLGETVSYRKPSRKKLKAWTAPPTPKDSQCSVEKNSLGQWSLMKDGRKMSLIKNYDHRYKGIKEYPTNMDLSGLRSLKVAITLGEEIRQGRCQVSSDMLCTMSPQILNIRQELEGGEIAFVTINAVRVTIGDMSFLLHDKDYRNISTYIDSLGCIL